MAARLTILFEDLHCLAVAKPADLPTQGGEGSLEEAVRRHLNPAQPATAYVGTVHRLDRPVSGVLLWAKTPKAARRLADQFARREVEKQYWALVEGRPPALDGTWEDWLGPLDSSGRARIVAPTTPGAKLARTRFQVGPTKDRLAGPSWLRLWPQTGRTHQLRAQTASRGLAILGDRLYGASQPFSPGIALHAWTLRVRHPILRHSLSFEAPLPPSWRDLDLPESTPG